MESLEYEFLWWYEKDYELSEDEFEKTLKTKKYKAKSLRNAANKMLRFANRKIDDIGIDYEVKVNGKFIDLHSLENHDIQHLLN